MEIWKTSESCRPRMFNTENRLRFPKGSERIVFLCHHFSGVEKVKLRGNIKTKNNNTPTMVSWKCFAVPRERGPGQAPALLSRDAVRRCDAATLHGAVTLRRSMAGATLRRCLALRRCDAGLRRDAATLLGAATLRRWIAARRCDAAWRCDAATLDGGATLRR